VDAPVRVGGQPAEGSTGSADIIYSTISTPPDQKRIAWFEVTEHEMFRNCEREATIGAVVDYAGASGPDRLSYTSQR